MKKTLSVVLALIMMLALGTMAFAANENVSFNIPVYYVAENAGAKKPAVGITVTIGDCETTGAPAFVSDTATLNFAASDKVEDVQFAVFTVDAATLTKPGQFVYPVTQSGAEALAGVTYDDAEAELTLFVTQGETAGDFDVVVKVTYDDEKVVGGKYDEEKKEYVKDEDTTPAEEIFTNTYKAAAVNDDEEAKTDGLFVKKTVTGNFGDKNEEFTVKVKFTSATKLGLPIEYTDSGVEKTVSLTKGAEAAAYTGEATITLKHDETVRFNNIPYGVSYEVVENDYTTEGYDAAEYSNEKGTINAATVSVGITNNRQEEIDTGVILDYLPYVLILAFVAAAGALIVVKKRKSEEY